LNHGARHFRYQVKQGLLPRAEKTTVMPLSLQAASVSASRRIDTPDPDQRWHELVSQVGMEIAEPLTAALERIHLLTSTGQIDRAGLRALRDEVEQARQAGMIGQQLTRFATGRVRQSHEVLQLEEVLKSVLTVAQPGNAGARHRPQTAAQVGARDRRRLAPVQPPQRHP
jgi:hypothetical protein